MLLLALLAAATPTPATTDCAVARAVLVSDQRMFDTALTRGPGTSAGRRCYLSAAEVLRDRRDRRGDPTGVISWREGQLRASAGEAGHAALLFERTRKENDASGWNVYLDGSIAFLRDDRAGLQRARDRLATLPPPPLAPGSGSDSRDRLGGLLRCFGRPYAEAYACTAPAVR